MNRKQKIIVSVTGIFLVLTILIGLTYAYFLTTIKPNSNPKSVGINSANLSIRYDDGDGSILTSDTYLFPSSDPINTKTFKVINEGDETDYGVIVDNISIKNASTGNTTKFNSNDFVYTLECVSSDGNDCDDVKTQTTLPLKNNSILVENKIGKGATHTYTLTLWYLDSGLDQSDDMNKTLDARINIEDIRSPESLAYNIIVNSKENKNGTRYVEPDLLGVAENTSILAEQASMENESIISYTDDDYGTSYYYRGNVQDNYVTFAGMCWRIVRIDGNNNIKLILEDQDESCSITMNGNWDIEASDGTTITTTWIDNVKGPKRTGNFGYYSSAGYGKMSYLNPGKDSDIAMVNAFKYFQTYTLTNKISSTYENKSLSDFLVSGNWCLNNKAYSDRAGTILLENPDYSSRFYYDSWVRLYTKTTKEPTLKCSVEPLYKFDDNQDGVISNNETDMYVGTLTADEIVYAGGKVYLSNSNYYLINHWQATNSKRFWSLSPSEKNGYYDFAFYVDDDGLLYDQMVGGSYDANIYAFRPSVSLNSGVKIISGGLGTKDKPYVIK